MGTPPIIFAYVPGVHDRIIREVPQVSFACHKGCQDFLGEVQKLADRRGDDGDKSNGRFYLHYMQLTDGYPQNVHNQILKELGLEGKKEIASPNDFVEAAEKRAFDFTAQMILDSHGKLSKLQSGRILYILGVLIHAYQDKKHLCGNITDGHRDGLTSSAHFSWDIHQLFSDAWPSDASEKEALGHTVAFLNRFQNEMKKRTGSFASTAFRRLSEFEMEPGKKAHDYKPTPADMALLFPVYPTRDLEVQGHWTLRLGYFWGNDRSGMTAEAGRQWYLPRTGPVRFQTGLGLHFTRDWGGRSEAGLKGSLILAEQVDFLGAGVNGLLGVSSEKIPYYGVEGVLKLFEGNLLFQAGRVWYREGPAETRLSLAVDAFALARSFEWIPRDF